MPLEFSSVNFGTLHPSGGGESRAFMGSNPANLRENEGPRGSALMVTASSRDRSYSAEVLKRLAGGWNEILVQREAPRSCTSVPLCCPFSL